ncbi:hypothetical protein [Endozoicomonas sp. 8E]|nr:hypothetical protein [Endozoicomonas sp. 8E]WOG30080.1 hypothetical protein P6910_10615 [Endozoicomonas sp. 8E]
MKPFIEVKLTATRDGSMKDLEDFGYTCCLRLIKVIMNLLPQSYYLVDG